MDCYIAKPETLREVIIEYGVAIIPSVLDHEECESIVSGLWDYFEHITKEWPVSIKQEDRNTWKEIYKLLPLHSMLFQHFNSGHAQISWDVRQNLKIIEIFAHFWDVSPDELLVSFDGFSFNIPPEFTNRGWNRGNTWFHTDQSYSKTDFRCIQSWVTGLDVNEGDATLSFMEKSNVYHKEFREWKESKGETINKKDWYKLNRDEEQFYLAKGCTYQKITCPKGSLVFWDSRTIHCGSEAMRGREMPNFRAIIYLCYLPRSLFSKKNIEKRITAHSELRTTNHWGNKLFSKNPSTYHNAILPDIKQINPPTITEIGRRLIGYEN
jgi:hypothetical protein